MALVEDTGLRRPGEAISTYVDRIACHQPGETTYEARVVGYLDVLDQAAHATAAGRSVPPLQHADAANRQIWQRVAQALSQLPVSVREARAGWRDVMREERRNWQSPDPKIAGAPYRRLGAALNRSLAQILAAYSALRDARP
jgi:hypothetical protein